MSTDRIARIRACLEAAFSPNVLEIVDDGHLHVGHAGASEGKGHFTVRIISPRFKGVSPLERHRMVFDALSTMLETDIHALRLSAAPPRPPKESPQKVTL